MDGTKGSIKRSELADPDPQNKVEFGQEDLAAFVASEVEKDPDIHVAINGPWGSGKTTVLAQIQHEIENEHQSAIPIWYEPWKYSPDQTTLRRTFLKKAYEDASSYVSDLSIDEKNFHFERLREEERTHSELLAEFVNSVWKQRKAALVLGVGILVLLGLRLLSGLVPSTAGATILTAVFDFIILFSLTGVILFYRNEVIGTVADLTSYEIKEPKINEIDLFEKKYEELLDELAKNDKRLVLFIDDIDRCNQEEIKEVIIGLSTYLDPDHEDTPVAVVAAIDGPKVVSSFHQNGNNIGYERPNIIHKSFQFVLPVPSLSRKNVADMVRTTAEDLDYPITEADVEHITSISLSHGTANPRIIRSALSDVVWMKDYGTNILKKGPLRDSESLEKILSDDYILYRIALIKMLSKHEDLLMFLTDAQMWIDSDEREPSMDVEWKLFDKHPKFSPNGLDPRPLLALNHPNEYSANVHNFDQIKKRADRGDDVLELCEDYDSATKIDIAYRLLDTDIESLNREEKPNHINPILDLITGNISAIDENREDLFKQCYGILTDDPRVVDELDRSTYSKFFTLAESTGSQSLNELFDENSPLYSRDNRNFLNEMSGLVGTNPELIDRYLRLERKEIKSGNMRRSSRRAVDVFESQSVKQSKQAPSYLIELIDNWSFSDYPDGPAEGLLRQDVIEKLHSDEYKGDAVRVFQMVVSGNATQDFSDSLYENNWPTPEAHQNNSE